MSKYGEKTLSEIKQEPEVIRRALNQDNKIQAIVAKIIENDPKFIIITGSGTSYHAGNAAVYLLHKFACIPCYCVHPSEFPYFTKFIINTDTTLISISQSGESADTIEASTIAREKGALVIPIVNEEESTLAKLFPDDVIFSRAGKEYSVLATKTYMSQLAIVSSISLELGVKSGKLAVDEYNKKKKELLLIPEKIEVISDEIHEKTKRIAKYLKFLEHGFVLGTGPDIATSLETALKFKEGARIAFQGYSSYEFLHGPITLADHENLIIALIPPLKDNVEDEREKGILEIIQRVKNQGASVLVIASKNDDIPNNVDFLMRIPNSSPELNPFLTIVPLQYLVLEIALQKGLDPDKPKGLTKIAVI
ncbi:MAG: SIS domain-containing protein [Candidatus Hodarchaeota archaeon]